MPCCCGSAECPGMCNYRLISGPVTIQPFSGVQSVRGSGTIGDWFTDITLGGIIAGGVRYLLTATKRVPQDVSVGNAGFVETFSGSDCLNGVSYPCRGLYRSSGGAVYLECRADKKVYMTAAVEYTITPLSISFDSRTLNPAPGVFCNASFIPITGKTFSTAGGNNVRRTYLMNPVVVYGNGVPDNFRVTLTLSGVDVLDADSSRSFIWDGVDELGQLSEYTWAGTAQKDGLPGSPTIISSSDAITRYNIPWEGMPMDFEKLFSNACS